MNSTITITDKVTVSTVEDLASVTAALGVLAAKVENFAADGRVEYLSVEIKNDAERYRCGLQGIHRHNDRCEAEAKPARTYAQLVVKVTTDE